MTKTTDATYSFTVRYQPDDQDIRWPVRTNNLDLPAEGTVEIGATRVTFWSRDGKPQVLERPEIAKIERSPADSRVYLQSSFDDRYVTVWPQSPAEADRFVSLLGTIVTAHQQRERNFEAQARAISPKQWVTPTIIGLNVLMFAVMAVNGAGLFRPDGLVHIGFGSNYGPLTWSGEPWRLLSSAFIHFGVIHLAFNMFALKEGGVLTERLYGGTRLLVIYLLSAVSGNVVSSWWEVGRNSAGASGAVFGVYGALLVLFAMRRREIPVAFLMTTGKGALALCGYSLLNGTFQMGIDNAAHVGGLLGGAITGLLLVRPFDEAARLEPQPLRIVAAVAGVWLGLAALSRPLWNPGSERAAEIRYLRLQHDLEPEHRRILDDFYALSADVDAGRLPGATAADRLERDLIPAWVAQMRRFEAIAASSSPGAPVTRRLKAYEDYLEAGHAGLRKMADFWRGKIDHGEAEGAMFWMEYRRRGIARGA